MKVPFLDLAVHHRPYAEAFHVHLDGILETSGFVGGELVAAFEQEWARYCGATCAVGVANGTDALELALQALGIGAGDEVIVPTNTFVATAEAVVRVGAAPVFCDVEPDTLLMSSRTVAPLLGPAVAAVIAVHLFGQPVDMTDLSELTGRHGLALVEDAAQAHGATWGGQRVGSFGDAAAFSFYPGKNLGALGDAGVVTTSDESLACRIRELANHGRSDQSHHGHVVVGRNSRLDGLQAAFLGSKLAGLNVANDLRRSHHRTYAELLPGSVTQITTSLGAESVHHLEVVRSSERDVLIEGLRAQGHGVGIHYPTPCHEILPYSQYRHGDVSVAVRASREILSLPMFPELDRRQIEIVCRTIRELIAA